MVKAADILKMLLLDKTITP